MGNASGKCPDGFHLMVLTQLHFHVYFFGNIPHNSNMIDDVP